MPDRMRVMHVVLSLDVGGLERNVVNQVREGKRLGQEVSILCVERCGVLAHRAESLGARIYCANKPPGLRSRTVFDIREILQNANPDVLHTHQIGPLFYTGLASMGLKIPLIVHTEHGKENYAGSLKTRVLGRFAGSFTKIFYCLTQDMAAAVTDAGVVSSSKIRIILNGIDTAFYSTPRDASAIRIQHGIPATAPLIGTVGRLNEIKRQDVLIEAFGRLQKSSPDAHLLLVGDGPLRKSLEDQSDRLGIAERVYFAGYQADTTAYLHAMDIFALPSQSEGMPQALLEACAAGKPVVASRVGGIPEVIQNGVTGILVESGDVASLANALRNMLETPKRATEMANAAKAHVLSTFDIGRMAEEYNRDFRAALAALCRVRTADHYSVTSEMVRNADPTKSIA